MTESCIPLGPFDLTQPLGKGAMGIVWQAIHRQQKVPVAVKIIMAQNAHDETFRTAFQNEVRAVTRLHHPSIVMVLDYGEISHETAEASLDLIPEGSQFFAMEYANAGTLPRPKVPLPWSNTKFILLELLDALAHAHARNVIHRDIKPSNILLSRTDDGSLRLKLTDFGVAKAFGTREFPSGTVAGTPRYMSPEQILNEVRDQGPWTDLYSLGCLAYQFASGHRIFENVVGTEVLRYQLHCEPEPIQGNHLPEGFQKWLNRMLAKKINDRFQFAAEAAWELACLPDPVEDDAPLMDFPSISFDVNTTKLNPEPKTAAATEIHTGSDDASEVQSGVLETDSQDVFRELVSKAQPVSFSGNISNDNNDQYDLSSELLNDMGDTVQMNKAEVEKAIARQNNAYSVQNTLLTLSELFDQNVSDENTDKNSNRVLVPAPATWRRAKRELPSQQLVGAGLGLWGLRSIPLIDRYEERDKIYQMLLDTRNSNEPHCLLIDGTKGAGKTRLVEWMSERANELAIAYTLKAIHYPELYNTPGLARAILYYLNCNGLTKFEALPRVENFIKLHPLENEFDDAPLLVELMQLEDDPEHVMPKIQFKDQSEQFELLYRFLQRLCQDRPCILWLDDLQWSYFSLAFIDYIFDKSDLAAFPLLVISTVNDEDLEANSQNETLYQHIKTHPRTESLRLEALSENDHRTLVKQLLDLDDDLTEQVVERTNGTPLFAIQLVGSWVERGILTAGPNGFILKEGASTNLLPDSLHELWISRVRLIFKDSKKSQYAWESLEIAACIGNHFDPEEWRLACEMEELGDISEVREIMLSHKLFETKFSMLAFAHNMLRESLIRYAQENARYKHHNDVCAEVLEHYYKDSLIFYHERRANYLLKADNYEATLEHLLQAAILRTQRAEYHLAHELFRKRDNALEKCRANEDSPIRALGWIAEAKTFILESKLEDAFQLIQKSIMLANRVQSWLIQALAYKELGNLCHIQNGITQAIEAFQSSLKAFDSMSPRRQKAYLNDKAEALSGLSKIYFFQHNIELSKEYITKAIELQTQTQDQHGLATSYRILGNCLQDEGNIDGALSNFMSAQQIFEKAGYRLDVARCLNNIGELYRLFYNQPEYAEQYYRNAIHLMREVAVNHTTPSINLALLLLAKKQFQEAKSLFLAQIESGNQVGQIFDLNWSYAGMLPCCAATFDWPSFEYYAQQLQISLQSSNVVDQDILFCTELAIQLCAKFGTLSHAKICLQVAREQAEALNDTNAITRLKAVNDGDVAYDI